MKKHITLLLAVLIPLVALTGCQSKKPSTSIKLTITTNDAATFDILRLGVRTIDEPASAFFDGSKKNPEISMTGRDLGADPYYIELSPSEAMATKVAICAKAEKHNEEVILKGVAIATFVPGLTSEVTINLSNVRGAFIDNDDDCFPAADNNPDLVDCNDYSDTTNPFTKEVCDDSMRDENCNGIIDEGCSCIPGQARPCYNVTDQNVLNKVGVGICKFGLQYCNAEQEWGECIGAVYPEETDNCDDDLDNNCNGSVNEKCSCDKDKTPERYCFNNSFAYYNGNQEETLSHLFFEENAPGNEMDSIIQVKRFAKSLDGTGYCVAGKQKCNNGFWGDCTFKNQIDSTINRFKTESGIYVYMEKECDGVDEDCDGKVDENFEYIVNNPPNQFDGDGDGFTFCGTVPNNHGGIDPKYVDCDDSNNSIYPGAFDKCGDGIDQDCRYNNGEVQPQTTSRLEYDVLEKMEISPNTNPKDNAADFKCEEQPLIGKSCQDSHSYYFGFVESEKNNKKDVACYYNAAEYWKQCNKDKGQCLTEEDCLGIASQGELAAERPSCMEKEDNTCTGNTPPSWIPIEINKDTYHDCGDFDCDCVGQDGNCQPHYFGLALDVNKACATDQWYMTEKLPNPSILCNYCYYTKDLTETENFCDGNNTCLNDRLCLDKGNPILPEICMVVDYSSESTNQCHGITPPNYVAAPFGSDPFNHCQQSLDCTDYLVGWKKNESNSSAVCYLGGSNMKSLCNGNSEHSGCIESGTPEAHKLCSNFNYMSSVLSQDHPQEFSATEYVRCPSDSCKIENACIPGYPSSSLNPTDINSYCYTNREVCGDNMECDSTGRCAKANGQSCTVGTECASSFCADGVCCDTTCNGTCESCALPNTIGTCTTTPDNHSDNTCNDKDHTCHNGRCEAIAGFECISDSDCFSGHCVDKVCCQSDNCGTCESCNVDNEHKGICSPLASGSNDDDSCQKEQNKICGENGHCLKVLGVECESAAECFSNSCVDGVCCDSACDGICESCTAGTAGYCSAVGIGGTDDKCALNPQCGDGSSDIENLYVHQCNGDTGVGSCVLKIEANCDVKCTTIDGRAACPSECKHSGECATGHYCAKDGDAKIGHCIVKYPTKSVIANITKENPLFDSSETADNVCLSGHAVDGICCSKSCGTCETCSTNGDCIQVKNDIDADSCTGNKTCDYNGQCKLINGEDCSLKDECASSYCTDQHCCDVAACPTSCKDATLTFKTCGNGGECIIKEKQLCPNNFTCADNSSCLTSCQDSTQCQSGSFCSDNKCIKQRSQAAPCNSDDQCATGHCVDNVCCDAASCGECESCRVNGHGTCNKITNGYDDSCKSTEICDSNSHCRTQKGQSCTEGITCLSGNCVNNVCCDSSSCPDSCNSNKINTYTCKPNGECTLIETLDCPNNLTCADKNSCRSSCSKDSDCINGYFCRGDGICVEKYNEAEKCATANECASNYCVDGVCCDSPCNGICMACNIEENVGHCENVPAKSTDSSCANVCDGYGHCVKDNSASCSKNDECLSQKCVDGVCCESECAICQECNITGHMGTCTAVTKGQQDDDSCNTPGTACNGSYGIGSCVSEFGLECSMAKDCATGFCVDNVCCNTACTENDSCSNGVATSYACNIKDHAGTCFPTTTNCGLYACGTTSCNTSCTEDSHCSSTAFCSSSQCVAKLADNTTCSKHSECQSGVCSEIPDSSNKICVAAGKCANNSNGNTTNVGSTLCSDTKLYTCSAAGSWEMVTKPSAVSCNANNLGLNTGVTNITCTSGKYIETCSVCDGNLLSEAGVCHTSCNQDDAKCQNGYYCDNTICVAKNENSTSCNADNQCKSGNCANTEISGNSKCVDIGKCIDSTSHTFTLNNGFCSSDGASYLRCGASSTWLIENKYSGNCNIQGLGPNSGYYTSSCSTSGWSTPVCTSCTNYKKPDISKNDPCTDPSITECVNGYYYDSNSKECLQLKANEVSCTANNQCINGFCTASGKCASTRPVCEELTSGRYSYKNVNSSDELCGSNQLCDGHGACKFANGQDCSTNSECVSNICTASNKCDSSCGPCGYLGSNFTSCASYPSGSQGNCSTGYSCDTNGSCKKNNGQECSTNSECLNNICTAAGICASTIPVCEELTGENTRYSYIAKGSAGQCVSGEVCDGNGSCKKSNGEIGCNSSDNSCLSGHCINNVCCATACDTTTKTCSNGQPSNNTCESGTCALVLSDKQCPDDKYCGGTDGQCDDDQKGYQADCDHDYECKSNICTNNKCACKDASGCNDGLSCSNGLCV